MNLLTWQAPQGGETPIQYIVYRNSALTYQAGSISAKKPLQFLDHNRKPKQVYCYYIVTVTESGSRSDPASVSVTGKSNSYLKSCNE